MRLRVLKSRVRSQAKKLLALQKRKNANVAEQWLSVHTNPHQIMEKPTQFDLNDSIRQWRENLAASPSCLPDNLAELETHLRDSVALLQTKGLSGEEAFMVATRRIGANETLAGEFEKVNVEQLWINRALWMLSGYFAVRVLLEAIMIFVDLVSAAIFQAYGILIDRKFVQPGRLSLFLLALGGLLFFFSRSKPLKNGWCVGIMNVVKAQPMLAAAAMLLVQIASLEGSAAARLLALRNSPGPLNIAVVETISIQILPIIFGWLLFRAKAKKTVAV